MTAKSERLRKPIAWVWGIVGCPGIIGDRLASRLPNTRGTKNREGSKGQEQGDSSGVKEEKDRAETEAVEQRSGDNESGGQSNILHGDIEREQYTLLETEQSRKFMEQ